MKHLAGYMHTCKLERNRRVTSRTHNCKFKQKKRMHTHVCYVLNFLMPLFGPYTILKKKVTKTREKNTKTSFTQKKRVNLRIHHRWQNRSVQTKKKSSIVSPKFYPLCFFSGNISYRLNIGLLHFSPLTKRLSYR